MLAAEVATTLDALAKHFKESRADVISHLLTTAARRIFR